jgi:AcrR family transcriptional regulator
MPKKSRKIAARKPRTDALRNRKRILEVAKQAFTRFGANASLDDIAKEARVGAGPLYRHFPARDVLLEAVYRTEVEKLAAAEKKFSAPPSHRGLASMDVTVRRLHRGQADHQPRSAFARRGTVEAV